MTKYHSYVIKWEDSASMRGWQFLDRAKGHAPDLITSIGWLVHETKTAMTITTSMGAEGQCMDVLSIPKSAIRKKIKLDRYIAGMP